MLEQQLLLYRLSVFLVEQDKAKRRYPPLFHCLAPSGKLMKWIGWLVGLKKKAMTFQAMHMKDKVKDTSCLGHLVFGPYSSSADLDSLFFVNLWPCK